MFKMRPTVAAMASRMIGLPKVRSWGVRLGPVEDCDGG
eukprot:CAMPEP_0177534452 /NCGR_PEP_ID=MMETSP0369-20130122/55962_1 /TAXON_ID=447022 ORGANISM="Scrippsiella hangoei-like, Strain SHHI-4" /NCGR_SAMPLE_ID=MMETSP0369 /ASSEMBLY_ACC=CAM_ASM_000364 /LENGTH=37 /DNA_ID= /DNA_START= /DNA_END= /DNA_ORIENTATION=